MMRLACAPRWARGAFAGLLALAGTACAVAVENDGARECGAGEGACAAEESPGECGEITERGACAGETRLVFCARGELRHRDCSRRQEVCRVEDGVARCRATAGTIDDCGGIPPEGLCLDRGDTLVHCDGGESKTYDCAAAGMSCVERGGAHRCAKTPAPDAGPDAG